MRPAALLPALLAGWTVLGVVTAFLPPLLGLWAGVGGTLLVAVVLDAALLARRFDLACERRCTPALSLGEWHDVTLRFDNPSPRPVTVAAFDGYPAECDLEGLPQDLRVPAEGWAEIVYRVRPQKRGEVRFGATEILRSGPLGLLQRRHLAGEEATARVYPNFRQVAKLAMLAVDNRTAHMGIHVKRRRGEGTEFYQLREYRQGDSLRQIDWKAFSRRHQLISREYREEQNQQVIFLLDCGRRLHAKDGDLSHFDHVLNAVLLLSYVALRQGDGVGVLTFSGSDRWLPPLKGRGTINSVLNTVYDLQTTTAPSDFAEAAQRLAARQKRRALVVLVTNLRDDDSSELAAALAPLRRRHLVLIASLREAALNEARDGDVDTFDDALRAAGAHHYLDQRRRAQDLVKGKGVQVLDVVPEDLPVSLVNRYLDIKRSGVL